ncbi:MAG: preprotein translocase subunit YajC [Porticoccaceae bacterium]
MSFFIASALAAPAAAGPSEPPLLMSIVMFGGLFVFMYFVIIRPQQKRRKEHTNLVSSLNKGDEVVTNSGILGKISKVEGNFLILEVSDTVELKFQKDAIHAVLPKGTIKAIA